MTSGREAIITIFFCEKTSVVLQFVIFGGAELLYTSFSTSSHASMALIANHHQGSDTKAHCTLDTFVACFSLSERQNENISLWNGWEKFLNGNVYVWSDKKDYSYLCTWTMSSLLKEGNYWTYVETTNEESWCWITNIIPWSCFLGMYSTWM